MKKLILSLFILLASALTASVSARSTVYTGTIGTYKIHMVLDENYEGYYYYDHRPQSRFTLVKTHESESEEMPMNLNITLQEYAPGTNKNTGEFVGEWYWLREADVALVMFEGTFRNKSTGKTLPFEVSCSYEILEYID